MAKFTIAQLNKEIAHHGVELVKGRGYFYFASLDDRCIAERAQPASIYVYAFNHADAAWWRSSVNHELASVGLVTEAAHV